MICDVNVHFYSTSVRKSAVVYKVLVHEIMMYSGTNSKTISCVTQINCSNLVQTFRLNANSIG